MNSSKYFEKRSEMRMKKAHDKATVSMARVNKAYDNSLSRLKKEIKLLTKDFDGMKPEEIRDFLNGHISYDRYNEWLQIYKTTKDKAVKKEMEKLIKANATGFRIRRKEAMLRDIEMERLAMTGSQLDNFGSHLRNVYESTLNETGFKGINKNLIDEAMKNNWAGSNYSKRVWHNNKVLAKRIETNLFESFISGKSNKQIVDELEYLTDLGRHAANRLVRTETSYMVNSADLESSKQRGIKAKKFEATLDSRTSKVCRKHNQKIIPIDKIKIGENAPPLHPYCRSFLADVLQGWDYETNEELDNLMSVEYKENRNTFSEVDKENSFIFDFEPIDFNDKNLNLDEVINTLHDRAYSTIENLKKDSGIDIIKELNNNNYRDKNNPYDDNKSKFVKYIYHKLGYDKLPFEAPKNYTGKILFRGVQDAPQINLSARDFVDRFKNGPMDISGYGKSAHGRAIYAADISMASNYANDGEIIKMILDSNANKVNLGVLHGISKKLTALYQRTGDDIYKLLSLQNGGGFDKNIELIAALSKVDYADNISMTVIFNRGKVGVFR